MPTPRRPLPPLNVHLHIPHHFRCPISLELMRDPVTLCTGQTYDRSSIEKWVASGNTSCPVTMQKLQDFTLIPNHTLRRLIQEWCVANRSRGVERIPTPKQPADSCKVRLLLADASGSRDGNDPTKIFSIRALRNLAKESEKNRNVMVDSGAVPTLIATVFNNSIDANEMAKSGCLANGRELVNADGAAGSPRIIYPDIAAEEALSALVLLPLKDVDRLSIMQPQRLAFLSSVLRWGATTDARVNAASLIEMLSDSKELHELRVVLASTEGLMEGLVRLLRDAYNPRALKVGIKALFSLCLRKLGKEKAVTVGAPSSLIERLVDLEKADAERALGTIELLCTTQAGCWAVANNALAAAALVKVILKVSDRATEYAAGSLLAICTISEKAQNEAVQAGIIKELLLLIQSDCTQRAKTKAMNLLKLLRSAWLSSDHYMPEYGRTDVVPF